MTRILLSAGVFFLLLNYNTRAEGDITIQNKTYNSGPAVAEWSTFTIETAGSVLVKTGANVSFTTGEAIMLEPGFSVQAGGVFSAKIESPPTYNPGSYYSGTPFISLIGGADQLGLASLFNTQPFDIVVWNSSGTTPLINAPVLITIDTGSGWLAITNAPEAALSKTLAVNTDNDGSLQIYYKHGMIPYEKARVRAVARDANLFINTFTVGSGDLDGDGILDVNDNDLDGDQMPNGWEARYFLDPFAAATVPDHDEDGTPDPIEYLQGRNPTVSAITDTPGAVLLRVYSPAL